MSAYTTTRPTESTPEERMSVVKQIMAGTGIILGTFIVGYYFLPFPVPPLSTPCSRLMYTLQWQVVPACMLLAGIVTVASTRFLTPAINPLKNGVEQSVVAVQVKYVQNTLEQFVLSGIAQLMISVYLEDRQMRIIPVLVLMFVVGRITFWIGYTRSYLQRVLGMTITIVPTALVYVLSMYHFFINGPMSMLWR